MNEEELRGWWLEKAIEEVEATIPKAVEYSSSDLEVMGAAMEAMGVPEGSGVEAAIAFYALGKVARAVGALASGQRPSDDTWFDIGVYARMAQRVRAAGAWPGEGAAAPRGQESRCGRQVYPAFSREAGPCRLVAGHPGPCAIEGKD